jgi:hypothetical protein
MADSVPAPRSFRFNDDDLSRLSRLQTRLKRNARDTVSMALVHMLASLEKGEPIHVEIPSEQEEEKR